MFEEVQAGHADFGVVPVENSTEGTVNNTLDMFLTSPLKICGEVELRIHQHLMGRMHGLEKIVRVCSHQQSLAQCRQWLDEHLPERRARAGQQQRRRRAARARRGRHGGDRRSGGGGGVRTRTSSCRRSRIAPDNTTRFLVIGRKLFSASGNDKTTLLVSAGDTQSPGALHRLLEPLARNSISMTRIESRPSRRRKWDYVFFIDVDGHADEPPLKHGARELKKHVVAVPRAGSYPARCCERDPRVSTLCHAMPSPIPPNSLAAPGVRTLAPYVPGKPLEELEREYGITRQHQAGLERESARARAAGAARRSRRRRGRSGCIRTAAASS